VAVGFGLGIASTLALSAIVDIAPDKARGTAMTLRITGNRIGLVIVPLLAGVLAAATGVAGILFMTAASLAGSAVAMQRSGAKTRE
jgi:MFS family permease